MGNKAWSCSGLARITNKIKRDKIFGVYESDQQRIEQLKILRKRFGVKLNGLMIQMKF